MAYQTSEEYKVAIDSTSKETYVSGFITTQKGDTIQISNSEISPGSLYITNQCVDGDAFGYGSVFTAEMGITLKSEIDRYSLYGAKVILSYNILTKIVEGVKQFETIPLGEFYANDTSRVGRNITIKAYDRMLDLDVEMDESFTGNVVVVLRHMSTRFGFELSQSESELLSLTNATNQLSVDRSRIKTYRELLSFVCKVTCTFAAFDRYGKLKLYEFAEEPTRVIQGRIRTASKFSDFETYFKGVMANFVTSGAYKSYSFVNNGIENGLVLDMGSIPIVQGLDTTNSIAVTNIYYKLERVRYTPCDITFNGDPSIELGDLIVNVDRDGIEYRSLVTFYKWVYRGSHAIKSAGQNPKLLNSKQNQNKSVESLQAAVEAKEMVIHTHTNATEISFSGEHDVSVLNKFHLVEVPFVSRNAVTCIVMTTFTFEISDEGELEFYPLFDDNAILGSPFAYTFLKGRHTVSFTNYITTGENSIHRYTIKCSSKSNDEEKESPTVTAHPYALKVILFGQGLSETSPWDGMVLVNDEVGIINVELNSIKARFNEAHTIAVNNTNNPSTVSDRMGTIQIVGANIDVVGVTDSATTLFE